MALLLRVAKTTILSFIIGRIVWWIRAPSHSIFCDGSGRKSLCHQDVFMRVNRLDEQRMDGYLKPFDGCFLHKWLVIQSICRLITFAASRLHTGGQVNSSARNLHKSSRKKRSECHAGFLACWSMPDLASKKIGHQWQKLAFFPLIAPLADAESVMVAC